MIRWLKGREAGVGAEQGRRTSLLPACSQPSSSPVLPSRGCLSTLLLYRWTWKPTEIRKEASKPLCLAGETAASLRR